MNKLAAREEIETFSKEEKIDIILASETKINKNQKIEKNILGTSAEKIELKKMENS